MIDLQFEIKDIYRNHFFQCAKKYDYYTITICRYIIDNRYRRGTE